MFNWPISLEPFQATETKAFYNATMHNTVKTESVTNTL